MCQPDGPAPSPEALAPVMAALADLNQDMVKAGVLAFAGELMPVGDAYIVRAFEGGTHTADGPFWQGDTHVGGVCLLACPTAEAARAWAERAAVAIGLPIEVRAFAGE